MVARTCSAVCWNPGENRSLPSLCPGRFQSSYEFSLYLCWSPRQRKKPLREMKQKRPRDDGAPWRALIATRSLFTKLVRTF